MAPGNVTGAGKKNNCGLDYIEYVSIREAVQLLMSPPAVHRSNRMRTC